jgi:hypothetical protein
MGLCLVIKCVKLAEWFNQVNEVMELPWFIFEDIKFLGTDSLKYNRNGADKTSLNVEFTFRRMTKTKSIMSRYYWKAVDAVSETGSLQILPDTKRMVPVALDLSNIDNEGVRWVDMTTPLTSIEETLESLLAYLKMYEKKRQDFNTLGDDSLKERIKFAIEGCEATMRENYGLLYPLMRGYK